mmetsp:Transcript_1300/g.2736  ORF Transcript_1300/g.2736 Transcript_1300/m.2736 type:complete len:468 (-) Transcript_1300:154-1557(-)
MMDQDLESASAISPRMSICLKASKDDIADLLAEIEDDDSSLEDASENVGTTSMCTTARSSLSSSSILLTGTTFSILLASSRLSTKDSSEDKEQDNGSQHERQSKKIANSNTVRFSESVHFRNYLHASELTNEERSAAWFCGSEYRTIFRNNMKIIQNIGKKEKEMKKLMTKKKREEQKLKKKNKKKNKLSSNNRLNDGYGSCGSCNEVENFENDNNQYEEYIAGINRDEEQGYSARGLENETSKKRRKRDEIFLRAQYAVLSLQADLDGRMELMQEEFDDQMEQIVESSKTKKKKKKIFPRLKSLGFSYSNHENKEFSGEIGEKEIQEMAATAKLKFTQYAQTQYDKMLDVMAERYAEICNQHARDAAERGLEDERTARAIDWIEASPDQTLEMSSTLPQKGVVVDTSALPDEKRRPSASSTSETEESITQASSLKSVDETGENLTNSCRPLSSMKRAKKFLRRLTM